jgi:hypothetical protein
MLLKHHGRGQSGEGHNHLVESTRGEGGENQRGGVRRGQKPSSRNDKPGRCWSETTDEGMSHGRCGSRLK